MTKKKALNLVIAMVFGIPTIVISGCVTNRISLVDSDVLTLEKKAAGKVYIAWSDAYEDGDGFIVTGVLRRRDTVGLPIKAHVDVTILSPDGTIVEESHSSDVYVPRRIIGRGQSLKRFKIRFSDVPAQGSLIRLVSHSGLHNDAT